MRTALLLSLCVGSFPLAASAATYEIADLKALDKDQGWRELVDHLNDILPSKRDAEWRAIAERACTGIIDASELKDANAAQRVLDQTDELMKRYGWLKESKLFLARRNEVGLKAFGWTFSSSRHSAGEDAWLDKVSAFVNADAVTADLPLRGLKLVTSRLIPVAAFPLVKPTLARSGKGACKDAELQAVLLGALSEGAWKAESAEFTNTCWEDLKPVITAEVLKPDVTRTVQLKLCPVLVDRKALNPEQLKKGCTF